MRIEPIYLLAPKPKPPSIPTRRAFLIAGGTFFAGIGLGGACGYAAGIGASGNEGGTKTKNETGPTGDANLDRLRWLAVDASIDVLIDNRNAFLNVLSSAYPKDLIAWQGVDRLVEAILDGRQLPNTRAFAQYLSQVIERGDPTVAESRHNHIPALRQVR